MGNLSNEWTHLEDTAHLHSDREIWVLLQVDILSNESELHEVTQFVKDNAQRALGVQSAQVLPVSSRRALEAKLECGSAVRGTWVCVGRCSMT